MSEKILPSQDFVLLQLLEQKMSAGGLHIPDKARTNQRDAQLGKVIAVGPGRTTEYGAKVTADNKPGDHVLIARGAGVEVESEGKKYRLLRSQEILATVEESRIVQLGLVEP